VATLRDMTTKTERRNLDPDSLLRALRDV